MTGGETNLDILLKSMQPVMDEHVYVFHSAPDLTFEQAAKLKPLMLYAEEEGTAVILRKDYADAAGLDYTYPARKIILNVHSSLDAVGFLAAITNKLAAGGISVNPVSAHFHDHLFIPEDKAEQAMELLAEFAHG